MQPMKQYVVEVRNNSTARRVIVPAKSPEDAKWYVVTSENVQPFLVTTIGELDA